MQANGRKNTLWMLKETVAKRYHVRGTTNTLRVLMKETKKKEYVKNHTRSIFNP